MKRLLPLLLLGSVAVASVYFSVHKTDSVSTKRANPERRSNIASPVDDAKAAARLRLKGQAADLSGYAKRKGCSERIGFFVDMRLHSGLDRFFIYDLEADSVLASGLVAHGSCNNSWLPDAAFGNKPGCGCSSVGRYKIGSGYAGRFGTAFKLLGLDATNSNAFARFVVLHAYDCVPDKEIYPLHLCNSLGCPMVSYQFLKTAERFIRREEKPILLWVYR